MNRRFFIKSTFASLIIPSGFSFAADLLKKTDSKPSDYIFYDERFFEARQIAGKLSNTSPMIPVRGDITEIWNSGLNCACTQSHLMMRGVTTESFYFCLKVMVGSIAGMESQVIRINRDLFLWNIQSINKLNSG